MNAGKLRVVLTRPRFPENIGAAARAAANFGVDDLVLVQPERWDRDKALPMATAQGAPVLDKARLVDTLAEAVADCTLVAATTARLGGWRRNPVRPRQAAEDIAARLAEGENAALVFGPEDKGLANADLECCNRLIAIPTAPEASSLNLAQAVLLVLYECFLARAPSAPRGGELSRRVRQDERDLLYATLKQTLTDIDFLQADNPDYFFLPLARFFDRADLRRHEMDLFMGLCRQIRRPR